MATRATLARVDDEYANREAATEPADLDGRGIRHSELVRDLAFACWLDANGNAERARRLLVDACKQDKTGQLPNEADDVPSATSIRRWSKRDGWEVKLIDAAEASYGQRIRLHASRMTMLYGQSIDVLDEVTSPGYVPTQHDKARIDAAKHITAIYAPAMARVFERGQAQLDRQDAEPETPEFANATEANRFWIKSGGQSSG